MYSKLNIDQMSAFEKEKALKDLLKEFKDEIPENQIRIAYVKSLIGYADILPIIGIRQTDILVNQLITTGKIHQNADSDKTFEYIENLKKGDLPDFANSFYTINPEYILNYSKNKRDCLAEKFAEGDLNLKEILIECWDKGIKTLNSCGSPGFKYVMFQVDDENIELMKRLAASEYDTTETEIIFANTTDGKKGLSFIQRDNKAPFSNILDIIKGKKELTVSPETMQEIGDIMEFVYQDSLKSGISYLAVKQTYKGYNLDIHGFNYKLLELLKNTGVEIISDPSIIKGQKIGINSNELYRFMEQYDRTISPKAFGEDRKQIADAMFYSSSRFVDRIMGYQTRSIKDKAFIERLEQGKEENTDVLKSMSDEIWSLKAQVSTSQERVISRNIQILKLKSENRDLIAESIHAEEAKEDAIEEKEKVQAENERLGKQIDSLQRQNRELSSKNELLSARNEKLEIQNTELKDMFNRVKDFVIKKCAKIPFVGKSLLTSFNQELNEKTLSAPKKDTKEKFETRLPEEDQK